MTLHYTTLHYATLHATPRYATLHTALTTTTAYSHNYNYTTLHYTRLHYTRLYYSTQHYITFHYTHCTTPQLQLQLHYIHILHTLITLHTTTTPLHYNYNYSCTTPHYIQQLWLRPLQPLQKAQLQPPFGPSVDSLCHPCITTTHLSSCVLSLKLLPPPCPVLLVHSHIHWVANTHTCSETSYRITDVECIVRAKNTPVNLTGDGEWPGVRNSVEEFCRWNCNNVVDSVFNS